MPITLHSNALTNSKCPVCGHQAAEGRMTLGGYRIHVCKECSLHFAPEAFGAKLNYDDVHATVEYQRSQSDRLQTAARNLNSVIEHNTYSPFFKRFPATGANRLLDVGCGVGIFCLAATSLGWEATGIDVAETAVSAGRDRHGLRLRNATLEDIHKEGQRFDVVTMFEVLEHLTNPLETLRLASGLVRDGGAIFCTVPNWNCPEVQLATQSDWLPPIHLSYFTASALLEMGRRAGLESCEVGVIRVDPLPEGLIPKVKWIIRRSMLRKRSELGLWMSGRPAQPETAGFPKL